MTYSTCIISGQCRVKVAAITVGQAASHTELHGATFFLTAVAGGRLFGVEVSLLSILRLEVS